MLAMALAAAPRSRLANEAGVAQHGPCPSPELEPNAAGLSRRRTCRATRVPHQTVNYGPERTTTVTVTGRVADSGVARPAGLTEPE